MTDVRDFKDGHCYINSTCYAHAEPISPDQPCIVCNSATNTFEFLVSVRKSITATLHFKKS